MRLSNALPQLIAGLALNGVMTNGQNYGDLSDRLALAAAANSLAFRRPLSRPRSGVWGPGTLFIRMAGSNWA